MYEEGRGIAQNLEKAADMFLELLEDDLPDTRAVCRLASMYRDGRGVPLNKKEALELLSDESLHEDADVNYLHASILLPKTQKMALKRNACSSLQPLKITPMPNICLPVN